MATVVEVFADIGCPFTHLGLRRFVQDRARAGRTDDVQLWVRAWPLELVNGAPLDPALVAEEVRDLQALLDRRGFAGFEEASFPSSTLPALGLAAAGYRTSIAVGEAVSLHLRALLFEEGQDVSRESVLGRVAAEFDLEVTAADVDSVPADRAEGRTAGRHRFAALLHPDRRLVLPWARHRPGRRRSPRRGPQHRAVRRVHPVLPGLTGERWALGRVLE